MWDGCSALDIRLKVDSTVMVLTGLTGERAWKACIAPSVVSSSFVRQGSSLKEGAQIPLLSGSVSRGALTECRQVYPDPTPARRANQLYECALTVRRNRDEVLHPRGKLLALLLPPCSVTMTLEAFCELRSTPLLLKARPFRCRCRCFHFRFSTHSLRPSRHILQFPL